MWKLVQSGCIRYALRVTIKQTKNQRDLGTSLKKIQLIKFYEHSSLSFFLFYFFFLQGHFSYYRIEWMNWKWNFVTSERASSNRSRRTKQRFVSMSSAIIYVIMMWAGTKILTEKTRKRNKEKIQGEARNVLLRLVFLPTLLSCFSRSLRALQQDRT